MTRPLESITPQQKPPASPDTPDTDAEELAKANVALQRSPKRHNFAFPFEPKFARTGIFPVLILENELDLVKLYGLAIIERARLYNTIFTHPTEERTVDGKTVVDPGNEIWPLPLIFPNPGALRRYLLNEHFGEVTMAFCDVKMDRGEDETGLDIAAFLREKHPDAIIGARSSIGANVVLNPIGDAHYALDFALNKDFPVDRFADLVMQLLFFFPQYPMCGMCSAYGSADRTCRGLENYGSKFVIGSGGGMELLPTTICPLLRHDVLVKCYDRIRSRRGTFVINEHIQSVTNIFAGFDTFVPRWKFSPESLRRRLKERESVSKSVRHRNSVFQGRNPLYIAPADGEPLNPYVCLAAGIPRRRQCKPGQVVMPPSVAAKFREFQTM